MRKLLTIVNALAFGIVGSANAATFVQTVPYSETVTSTLNTGGNPAVRNSFVNFNKIGTGWQISSILLTFDGTHSGTGNVMNFTSGAQNVQLFGSLTTRINALTASAGKTTSHLANPFVPSGGNVFVNMGSQNVVGPTVALDPSEFSRFEGTGIVSLPLVISATCSTANNVVGSIDWQSFGTARITITAVPGSRGD